MLLQLLNKLSPKKIGNVIEALSLYLKTKGEYYKLLNEEIKNARREKAELEKYNDNVDKEIRNTM